MPNIMHDELDLQCDVTYLFYFRTVVAELTQQHNEELYGVMRDVKGFLQRKEG